ncbi:hypothetical protein SP15_003 [Bacillus phage SP-15]|uniref:Uncharacterized protein n=1 Tax=Bacillus phage SP-15 TaxID=1792032 RepID=A0A127AYK1_9CAUD|nr:hypothetical protein SP15_003 [Bacillus phage SP-15]AMM44801.1 hypothetical protein SP15_003 [Bacillus phage SP-15]
MRNRRQLECSSAGDKRFSSLYAKVSIFGKNDCIVSHVQLSKRFLHEKPKHWTDARGRYATHLEIQGVRLNPRLLVQWNKFLWMKYLDANPQLVEEARTYNVFTDKFADVDSHDAEAIKQYVKKGRESIIKECKELLQVISENNLAKLSVVK